MTASWGDEDAGSVVLGVPLENVGGGDGVGGTTPSASRPRLLDQEILPRPLERALRLDFLLHV